MECGINTCSKIVILHNLYMYKVGLVQGLYFCATFDTYSSTTYFAMAYVRFCLSPTELCWHITWVVILYQILTIFLFLSCIWISLTPQSCFHQPCNCASFASLVDEVHNVMFGFPLLSHVVEKVLYMHCMTNGYCMSSTWRLLHVFCLLDWGESAGAHNALIPYGSLALIHTSLSTYNCLIE